MIKDYLILSLQCLIIIWHQFDQFLKQRLSVSTFLIDQSIDPKTLSQCDPNVQALRPKCASKEKFIDHPWGKTHFLGQMKISRKFLLPQCSAQLKINFHFLFNFNLTFICVGMWAPNRECRIGSFPEGRIWNTMRSRQDIRPILPY